MKIDHLRPPLAPPLTLTVAPGLGMVEGLFLFGRRLGAIPMKRRSNLLQDVKTVDSEISVVEREGEFFVTSLQIAEHFGKEHKDVLKAIKNLELPEDFSQRNFAPSNYVDSRGKNQPLHLMSRDGFSLLVMGFTGSEALSWKIRYINAFNSMERELTRIGGAAWALKRAETKLVRKPLADTIKLFVDYAIEQGSESYKKNPALAYINITKMEYKALFLLSKNVTGIRDKLNQMDLNTLSIAERGVRKTLVDEMAKGTHYKDIYQIAKTKVTELSDIVGVSDVSYIENHPFKEIE